MLGLGGAHIGHMNEGDAHASIELAIREGIRFFDSAHQYYDGVSEERLGKFLVPNYREHVFLMTKAQLFEAATVRKQLETSLRRLKTDYLDLWQMHQVDGPEDVENRITGGVIEEFIKAKQEGKARYIGFTGHKNPAAMKRVLKETDVFDTCQMPVSCADPSYGSFILDIMPELVNRNIGIIGMKSLAAGGFFGGSTWFQFGDLPKICPDRMSVKDAIRFSLSLPISVLVTGPNNPAQLQEKIDIVRSFSLTSEDERTGLIQKAAELTPASGIEFYKAKDLPRRGS